MNKTISILFVLHFFYAEVKSQDSCMKNFNVMTTNIQDSGIGQIEFPLLFKFTQDSILIKGIYSKDTSGNIYYHISSRSFLWDCNLSTGKIIYKTTWINKNKEEDVMVTVESKGKDFFICCRYSDGFVRTFSK